MTASRVLPQTYEMADPSPDLAYDPGIEIDPDHVFDEDGLDDRYEMCTTNLDKKKNKAIYSLAELCAKHVAGKNNQNMVITILGRPGDGKSVAALNLALGAAQWLAFLKGGVPEDYFDMDKNLAVIEPSMLHKVMQTLTQHGIYILDDAGPGWDARDGMSNNNKHLNHILQTCRPSNNIIIITSIHTKMIDITVRRIARYVCFSAEVRHNTEGRTYFKVLQMREDQRSEKVYHKFPTTGKYRIVRFYSEALDDEIHQKYQKVRKEKEDLVRSSADALKADPDESDQPMKLTKREKALMKDTETYGQQIVDMQRDGWSAYKIAHAIPVSKDRIVKIALACNSPFGGHK